MQHTCSRHAAWGPHIDRAPIAEKTGEYLVNRLLLLAFLLPGALLGHFLRVLHPGSVSMLTRPPTSPPDRAREAGGDMHVPNTLSEGCGSLQREACSQGTSTTHRALRTPLFLLKTNLCRWTGCGGALAKKTRPASWLCQGKVRSTPPSRRRRSSWASRPSSASFLARALAREI